MPHEGSQREQLLQRMMSTDPWAGGMNPFGMPKSLAVGLPAPMFAAAAHMGRLELAYAKANPIGKANRTPSASTLARLGLGPDPHGPNAPSDKDRLNAAYRNAFQHKDAALDEMRSKTIYGLPMFGAFNQQAKLELIRAGQGVPNDRTPSEELLARLGRTQAAGLSPVNIPFDDQLGPAMAKNTADNYGSPLQTNLPPDLKRKKRRGNDIFGVS